MTTNDGKWPWLQTYIGYPFVPMNPHPDHVDIRDIAIALSREARYNGHTHSSEPYSVAQHCVLISRVLPKPLKFAGLLHDAAEAYIKDLTWSVKTCLPEYKAIETPIEVAIAQRFGLSFPHDPAIKEADNRMLATEKRDLMGMEPKPWRHGSVMPVPYEMNIHAWSHREARFQFLEVFNRLCDPKDKVSPYPDDWTFYNG